MSLYAILKPSPILNDLPEHEQLAITQDAMHDGEDVGMMRAVSQLRGQPGFVVEMAASEEADARREINNVALIRSGFVRFELLLTADAQSGSRKPERPAQQPLPPIQPPEPVLPWPHRPVT